MIVVADTGPLNYLIQIGVVDVLKPLYAQVLIPQTVADELQREKAPAAVQAWIARFPQWLEIRSDPPSDPTLQLLDPGEAAALALAEAERRHLHVTGTLGVLAEAHLAGLLNFDAALDKLSSTNFRLSPAVEVMVRRRLSSGSR